MNNGCGPDEMGDPNEDKVNPLCRCCCQKDDNSVVSLNEMFTAVQSSLGERRAIARLKAAAESGPSVESIHNDRSSVRTDTYFTKWTRKPHALSLIHI